MWKSYRAKSSFLGVILILSGSLTTTASASQSIELEDARFPVRQVTASGAYDLQGAGILKWGIWFDVYAAAYYSDPMKPQNQRLVIHYFVPVEAQQIKSAAEKHLLKQRGSDYFTSIKPTLDRLHAAMHDVEKGDSYALTLYAQQELILELNGEIILRLPEPELGRAYLDLWLGDEPLDKDLKQRLLGTAARS